MGSLSLELPLPVAPDATAAAAPCAIDDSAGWEEFSRPIEGRDDAWESYLAIEGMDCAGCTLTIEQALGAIAGVESVQVNGGTATARVVWDSRQCKPSDWLAALSRAGYRGLPAGDQLVAEPRRREQRRLLWRWLVAGFCMMQVMMYAVPAYVAPPGEITPDIEALLRWASWVMTVPVLLFACAPFFTSAWRDLRHGRAGMDVPVALGIVVAFVASTAATVDPAGPLGHEVWYDSVTMFVFFLLSGRLLEQRLRDRTAGALEALVRRVPPSAERRRDDGTWEAVAVLRLQVGDVVRVRAGEGFPADGTIVEGRGRVDEALLTGESEPLPRAPGDAVIAGSHNLSAPLVVRVERIGQDTRFAAIVALMERASVDKPRLAQLADRMAGPFLLAVMAAAGAAAWAWWPHGAGHAIGIAIAVLIVTCPCALSLATPAATLAAAGALARRGILVRRLEALEAAATIDTVVFDKTGTLTEDRMSVIGGRSREGVPLEEALALAGALARLSNHPASRAVARAAIASDEKVADVREIAGEGVEGTVVRRGLARRLRLGSVRLCGAPEGNAAGTEVHVADEAGWLASFRLDETLREDALPTVTDLQSRQLRVQLLSGDRNAAVGRLAARAGIGTSRGQQSPQDKLAHVQTLQGQGGRVAMVGDGLNDGPVLARADVAFAMGRGAPLAQSQSDFVVLGGQLGAIPATLAQARRMRSVVRQNLAWAAAYNAVCVPLALAGSMPPWLAGLGMAFSSLFVVANSARLARLPATAPRGSALSVPR